MKTLIYTSVATAILASLVLIFMIWSPGIDEIGWKVIITLGVLFIVQACIYLVIRDVQEESSGKKDGTIAK